MYNKFSVYMSCSVHC